MNFSKLFCSSSELAACKSSISLKTVLLDIYLHLLNRKFTSHWSVNLQVCCNWTDQFSLIIFSSTALISTNHLVHFYIFIYLFSFRISEIQNFRLSSFYTTYILYNNIQNIIHIFFHSLDLCNRFDFKLFLSDVKTPKEKHKMFKINFGVASSLQDIFN